MANPYYDEIEIEDFTFNEDLQIFTYPCPCGDKFVITSEQLVNGEDVAKCPSCSLLLKVIYNIADFEVVDEEADNDLPETEDVI